jgi:hypothetical protein
MNQFCRSFQHSYSLPSISDLYPDGDYVVIKRLDKAQLDPKFFQWLRANDIHVSDLVVAWKPPQTQGRRNTKYGTIHSDGQNISKINFVLGGTGSQMIWFDQPRFVFTDATAINTPYQQAYAFQTLKELYRTSIQSALVNAAAFHYIENTVSDRFAIQCTLIDSDSGQHLSFAQAHTRLFG